MAVLAASAATVVTPAAAVLVMMTMTWLQLQSEAAAAPPLSAPAPVGRHGCNTTCGEVLVPYPFGFGPEHCHWKGLNLTCDATTNAARPRLLLGDGTLRVTEISIVNNTVRVWGKAGFLMGTDDDTHNITYARYPFGRSSFLDHGYRLSSRNELFLHGCNVAATLLGDASGEGNHNMLAGCAAFCDWGHSSWSYSNTTAGSPFCVAPVSCNISQSIELQISSLYSWKQAMVTSNWQQAVQALVAEKGWGSRGLLSAAQRRQPPDEGPLILQWAATQGLGGPYQFETECPDDVRRKLCKSQHSDCIILEMQCTCQCQQGYGGNPYLVGGCQDIDECMLPSQDTGCWSGECINTVGSFYCGCPPGSYGDPSVRGGCVKNSSDVLIASSQLLAPSAPIGLLGCNTTCGKLQVPYPFGLGPAQCYRPGLKLTCDTSHNPPRLLLGDDDATLQVVDIFLPDSTVRVIRTLNFTTTLFDNATGNPIAAFDLPSIGEPYSLSSQNEFILNGCGTLQATLQLQFHSGGGHHSNCSVVVLSSNCSSITAARGPSLGAPIRNDYCSGTNGCCHAPICAGSTPKDVTFHVLNQTNLTAENIDTLSDFPIYAFLTEGSLSSTDQQHLHMNLYRDNKATFQQMASPLILQWAVKQGFPAPLANNLCPGDVAHQLCTSDHSDCRQQHGGYTCKCSQGYDGNPYIKGNGGCKDIDECTIPRILNACFGDCINLVGSYKCRCPRGTHGNSSSPNGCRPSITGSSIGIGVGSGAGFILLVLVTIYMIKKLKHRSSMKLKQKYFKQNHGQLLQQLVAQRADITQRMIITLEELEKATNNFDKDRELGVGAHGTVYMGILSDHHVVAIKKAKIAKQTEINEFINEVAILSQINHRNVVKLFGCCLETKVPLLVYEFVSNGTLYNHLHVEGAISLSWNDRLRIATETAKAIAYIHSAISIPIIHRDIKSTNILLNDTLTSKVSDFGASRHVPIEQTGLTTSRVQGTFGYMDPAYYRTRRLTAKSDVYSFGVLLIELLTRKKPSSVVSSYGIGLVEHFVRLHMYGTLAEILDQQVTQEGGNQQATEVAALAVTCVKLNEDERPSMRQVELTLEAIKAKGQTSGNDTAEVFEETSVRRRLPSDTAGRSMEGMTRRYSLEEEFLLSASYPR